MARFPFEMLLYTASLAMAGGAGWYFYRGYQAKQLPRDPAFMARARESFVSAINAGRELRPAAGRWSYDNARQPWWMQVKNVNLTGKLPPEPEPEKVEQKEPEAPKDTGVPLDDILIIESLICEVGESNQATQVVVRYKPNPDLRPPIDATSNGGGGYAGPGDATRAAPAAPFAQSGAPGSELRQHLFLNDTLWPPFDNIRLVRVADDAQSAFFERSNPGGEKAKEEELFKNELELDAELVAMLRTDQRRARGAGDNPSSQQERQRPVTTWRNPAQTQEVEPGHWHVSRDDHEWMSTNWERVMTEDIGIRGYTSRSGRYSGVQVTRVPERMQGWGISQGDVILSINGQKVGSQAEAIKIGTAQYKRGTRTFEAEVLSSRGIKETKRITIPDQR